MSDAGFAESKLGGLPSLSYGPVTAQPAPVPQTDATVAAWDRLGDQVSQISDNYVKQQATIKGSQAVTRDANGNLQFSPHFPLTGADEAYNAAGQQAYLAQSQLDVRDQIAKIQAQHIGDIDGFRQAIDQMTAGQIGNAPSQFQPAVRNMITQEAGYAMEQIQRQQYYTAAENAKNTGMAAWESDANVMYGFARSGEYDPKNPTPYQSMLLNRMASNEAALKNNPAIALSPGEGERFNTFRSQLTGETALANARADYQQYGEAEAEQRLIKAINDPSLNLSPDQRQQIQSQGVSEIRMLDGMARGDRMEAQQEVSNNIGNATQEALTTGNYSSITDGEIRQAYANDPAKADRMIGQLHAAVAQYGYTQQTKFQSPAEDQAMLAKANPATPGNTPTAAAPKMSVGQAIFGQESSFGKNAGPSADGSSTGPMQIAPATFARYAKPGESIDNPQDNYAVGQRIIADYEQRWPNDPARVATAYFSGPGNVAPAGSATPYLHNTADANGKTVSSYVGDVLDRMGTGSESGMSDYAARQRAFEAAHAAVIAKQKALNADPSGYVQTNSPGIQQMFSSGDPTQIQNGIGLSLDMQKQLGATNPRPLSNSQAQYWIGRFTHPPEGVQTADNMIGTLQAMQGQLGQYYPQAFAQVSKSLPPEAIGLDWTKDDPAVAARMANAVNTGRAALDKIIPNGTGAAIDQSVMSGLSDFNSTVRGFGGSALTSKMAQATGLYARQLVAEGVDPGKAGEQAVQDIIGKNYTFQGTYRVPTGVNAGGVARGVDVATRDLSNVEPYANPSAGVSSQFRQSLGANSLRSNGAWLTLPDDSGLRLTWGPQSGWLGARDSKGNPIQYTWAQLAAMGNSRQVTQTGTPEKIPGAPQLGVR